MVSAIPSHAATDGFWFGQNSSFDATLSSHSRFPGHQDLGAFATDGNSGSYGGTRGRGDWSGKGGSGNGGGGSGGYGSGFGGFSDGQGLGLYFIGVNSAPTRKTETLGKALWQMVSAASLLQTICFLLYTDYAQAGELTHEDGFDEAELS